MMGGGQPSFVSCCLDASPSAWYSVSLYSDLFNRLTNHFSKVKTGRVPSLAHLNLNSPDADFSLMVQRIHMQAAQCQWALVMFFLIFLGTFAHEFRHNRFYAVCTDDSGNPPSLTLSEVSRYQLNEQ